MEVLLRFFCMDSYAPKRSCASTVNISAIVLQVELGHHQKEALQSCDPCSLGLSAPALLPIIIQLPKSKSPDLQQYSRSLFG